MNALNERTKRRIALLAGEDLDVDDEEARDVRRLIANCPECRRYWMRIRGCLDVLDRCDVTEDDGNSSDARGGSTPGVWREIEPRLHSLSAKSRRRTFNGWIPALGMTAACIAMLVAGQMDVSWQRDGNWSAMSNRAVADDPHSGWISISRRDLRPMGRDTLPDGFGTSAATSFGGLRGEAEIPWRRLRFGGLELLVIPVQNERNMAPRPMHRLPEVPFLIERITPGRTNGADLRISLFRLSR